AQRSELAQKEVDWAAEPMYYVPAEVIPYNQGIQPQEHEDAELARALAESAAEAEEKEKEKAKIKAAADAKMRAEQIQKDEEYARQLEGQYGGTDNDDD